MKPSPAPAVPGNTPWERLDSAVRTVFSVTKEEFIDRARLKKKRLKKKRAKKK